MKLYQVPRNTLIRIDGELLLFHHIDGMYSFCTYPDHPDRVVHLYASTEVDIEPQQHAAD